MFYLEYKLIQHEINRLQSIFNMAYNDALSSNQPIHIGFEAFRFFKSFPESLNKWGNDDFSASYW
jgi:hypothetical protein